MRFVDAISKASMAERVEAVRVFRVDWTYQSNREKITMHIEKTGIRLELLSAMDQIADVERKMGRSPPTTLERELQDWVESFMHATEG